MTTLGVEQAPTFSPGFPPLPLPQAKCLEAGINVFLEKPVNFATLQSTLADFVHGP